MPIPTVPPPFRIAAYYAPDPDDPLHAAAATWLGRDALTGKACRQPDIAGLAEATDDARRYGFHATLKPPMRLAEGCEAGMVAAAARDLAARIAPFALPKLAVADIHGFLALRETVACPALQALADACVAGLDRFRAPPDADERARRRAHTLAPAQAAMLQRWGYPHVFETWFFHMTLTRRLSPAKHAMFRPAAERHFAAALAVPRRVSALCLFTEAAPGAPFTLAERFELTGTA